MVILKILEKPAPAKLSPVAFEPVRRYSLERFLPFSVEANPKLGAIFQAVALILKTSLLHFFEELTIFLSVLGMRIS